MGNKKIGVITLPGRYNYGNRLQNYAVVKIYERLGFQVESLELEDHTILRAIKRTLLTIAVRRVKTNEELMSGDRLNAFNEFSSSCHIRTVGRKRGSWRKEFDCFSVGSDQVWNPNFVNHRAGWYFLDFTHKAKRIALCPSIGVDELSPAQSRKLATGVRGFPRVSVREERGAKLIQECSGKNAEVICDPTMVLPADEWRAAADNSFTPSSPYVFTYLLGGANNEASEVLCEVTDHGAIPVIPLSDRQKPEELDAGPAEFLSLIDNAVHVVTDSFHAAVFASILQTPLTIVHREEGASMFSRLEQLSKTLGIEHKVFGSPNFDLSRAGDYRGVSEAIARERDKFMSYLRACLNG